MTTFGEALRSFRQASNDPDRLNRRLTQERLGMLIGDELGPGSTYHCSDHNGAASQKSLSQSPTS